MAIKVLLEELVERASAVAVITPAEHRAIWEGDEIVTYTHVHVDRVVAGQVARDAWVRTLGGSVGDIAQIVEGEATFVAGRPLLAFLRPRLDPASRTPTGALEVVERGQGAFPIVTSDGRAHLALGPDLGALVPPRDPAGAGDARPARDVLARHSVDEAAREVAAAWARAHGRRGTPGK